MLTPDPPPARENRYLRAARSAYALARTALPTYANPRSPHLFSLHQLAACVLLADYLKLSHRAMTEWLQASDQVCVVLGLERIPDHSTLSRTRQKLGKEKMQRLGRLLRDEM